MRDLRTSIFFLQGAEKQHSRLAKQFAYICETTREFANTPRIGLPVAIENDLDAAPWEFFATFVDRKVAFTFETRVLLGGRGESESTGLIRCAVSRVGRPDLSSFLDTIELDGYGGVKLASVGGEFIDWDNSGIAIFFHVIGMAVEANNFEKTV